MPEIPQFDPQIDVRQNFTPRAEPGALAAGGEALARGGQQLYGAMLDWNEKALQLRRAGEASNIQADASKKLNDAYFKWSRVPDRAAAEAGFQQDAEAIKKDVLSQTSDAVVRAHVTDSFNAEATGRLLETGRSAFGLEIDKRKGELRTNLFNFANAAASASDPMLQGKIVDDGSKAIAGMEAAGVLTGDEAAAMRLRFGSDIQKVKAEQLIDKAVQTQDPRDSNFASAAIADPKNFIGLDPQERESLAFRVDRLNDRLENRALARQAHNDAVAQREFTRAQGHNEAMILGGVWAGKSLDPAVLEKLMDTGQISAAGGEAIHSAMEKRNAGSDDPVTTVALWHNIDSGRATVDDVYDAVKAGKLKGETAATMTRELDAGTTPAAKDALDVFKRAVTGSASGSVAFGGRGATQEALAEGLGAFHQRLGAGESPNQVLAELVPLFAPAMTKPTFLAAPKFGEPQSSKELQAIGNATFKAHEAKQIDDSTYSAQVELLNDYRRWFAAKDEMARAQAAAAAKAAKKPQQGGQQ